jgi:hypothetical protein
MAGRRGINDLREKHRHLRRTAHTHPSSALSRRSEQQRVRRSEQWWRMAMKADGHETGKHECGAFCAWEVV